MRLLKVRINKSVIIGFIWNLNEIFKVCGLIVRGCL